MASECTCTDVERTAGAFCLRCFNEMEWKLFGTRQELEKELLIVRANAKEAEFPK